MTKEERMNVLANAGIDTSKYYTVNIDKDLPKGTTFTITIGENGLPTLTKKEVEEMVTKIEADGYINNQHLFRRWVMAQMFRMEKSGGFTKALKAKPYFYQWKMLINELNAMAKIEKEDPIAFNIRKDFFTKEAVVAMLQDYKVKLRERKGYLNIWSHSYISDAIRDTDTLIIGAKCAKNYKDLYECVIGWKRMVWDRVYYNRLPDNTEKCAEWIDAYKGAGAYYTMENMIKFHQCRFYIKGTYGKSYPMTLEKSLIKLEEEKVKAKGSWWKLLGVFRQLVRDNDFNFTKRMREVHKQ